MTHDLTTYEGRKAYIAECEKRMAADRAKHDDDTQRHERRAAAIQKTLYDYIFAINEPLRQMAADIRRSV